MNSLSELALAIRFLSVDAVEKAQSGHPGMPLGMADIATVLWKKFLKHSPKNPKWFNRDRFVLSNGHGSMLLYSLLHLTGYKLSLDEIKRFRQLHSLTPGHPECTETPGVETTTGPLGQGLANAVGMAIAEKILAATFNMENLHLVDHYTYAFAGDGCMMEGISHEACSLAGTLGLGKLIVFYDDNGISIDGDVKQWFTDDTAKRFQAYHWHVIDHVDGHNPVEIEQAIMNAQREAYKPTLIICKTVIGYGSLVAGTAKAHGSPLGAEGAKALREHFSWSYEPFEIPPHLYTAWDHRQQGDKEEQQWLEVCDAYKRSYPEMYADFLRRANGDLPDIWTDASNQFIHHCQAHEKALATRQASQQCLEVYGKLLPELFGGSADLSGSNNTFWSGCKAISHDQESGNYLYYGVREFAMAAISNGLALHGGFLPYAGTFLVFSDYARNAVRLSALMKQRVIYIFSHDSIGLGEDGPTHQPIEHASMLRITPGMEVWRPADLVETSVAWQQAIERHSGPSSLLLSRQALPQLYRTRDQLDFISQGAYILKDCTNSPEAIIIATGSEVHLALQAAEQALQNGYQVRVVSMPCAERFLQQPEVYQEQILPAFVRKRVAVEAAASAYWYRFVGLDGKVVGIDRFGVSAPAKDAYQELGITVRDIIAALTALLDE